MSLTTDVQASVKRGSQTIYPSVTIKQIDSMSQQEAQYYGGSGPYFRSMAYILANLDIRYGDYLIDAQNIDPLTHTNYTYKVINDPSVDSYPDSHMELVIDRIVGT
jgi:hypothetical protein